MTWVKGLFRLVVWFDYIYDMRIAYLLCTCLLSVFTFHCSLDAQEITASAAEESIRLPQRGGNGLFGYVGIDGKWVIDAKYETVRDFNKQGFAFVKNEDGWNCIDSTGNVIVSNVAHRLEYGDAKSLRSTDNDESLSISWIQLKEDSIAILHRSLGELGRFEMTSNYNKNHEFTSGLGRIGVISVQGSGIGWRTIFVNGHQILYDKHWKEFGRWAEVPISFSDTRFYVHQTDSTTTIYDYDQSGKATNIPYVLQPYSAKYPGLEVHSRVSIKTTEWNGQLGGFSPFQLYLHRGNIVLSSSLIDQAGDTLISQNYPARSGIYPCGKDNSDAPSETYACTSPPIEVLDQIYNNGDDFSIAMKKSQTRVLLDSSIPNPTGESRILSSTDSTWWVLTLDSLKLISRDSKTVYAETETTQFGEVLLEDFVFTEIVSDTVDYPYSNMFATPYAVYRAVEGRFEKIYEIESSFGDKVKRAKHHLFAAAQLMSIDIKPSSTRLYDPDSGWLLGHVSKAHEDIYIGMCANQKWGVFDSIGNIIKPPIYDILICGNRGIDQFIQKRGFVSVMTFSED